MCRCRDTGSKRCKWEHAPDSWHWNMRQATKKDRRTAKALMRQYPRTTRTN